MNSKENDVELTGFCINTVNNNPCRKRNLIKSPIDSLDTPNNECENYQLFEKYDNTKETDENNLELISQTESETRAFNFFNLKSNQLKKIVLSIKNIFLIILFSLIIYIFFFFISILFRSESTEILTSYKFKHASVATDSPHCSDVGAKILKKGGNAVDAAVASAFCLGVRRPFASGIGGGGFMVVHMNSQMKYNKKYTDEKYSSNDNIEDYKLNGSYSIDFRENAGQYAFRDMYEPTSKYFDENIHPYHYGHFDKSTFGGGSIAVPGEILGLYTAHKKFGKLPWEILFEEPIKMAEEGFYVEKLFALRCKQREEAILNNESLSKLLTKPNNMSLIKKLLLGKAKNRRIIQEGDFLIQPQLAKTLRIISKTGPKEFYEGDLMKQIVKILKKHDSYLTEDDFRKYQVKISKAYSIPFHGSDSVFSTPRYSIITTQAPSSGPIIAFALQIIDRLHQKGYFIPRSSSSINPFTIQNSKFWHYIIEVLKHAFSHRTFIGDPDFVSSVNTFINNIKSREYIDKIISKIDPGKTFENWKYYVVNDTLSEPHDSGTTALSIIDEEGNAVSMATTVNHSFGSLVFLEELGFVLNNHMSDFSVSKSRMNVFGFLPSKFNIIEAYKRPVSSISPIILLDHGTNPTMQANNPKVKMAISASGGSTIISALLQTICMHIYLGIPVHHVIAQPRLHILPGMEEVRMESGFSHSYAKELQSQFGHRFKHQTILADGHSIGNVQVLSKQGECIEAYSDDRKNGQPSGY